MAFPPSGHRCTWKSAISRVLNICWADSDWKYETCLTELSSEANDRGWDDAVLEGLVEAGVHQNLGTTRRSECPLRSRDRGVSPPQNFPSLQKSTLPV